MKPAAPAFWLACALVVGVFFLSAGTGGSEWGGSDPADLYYNSLVRGFQAGQLSLKKAVPPGLASLPDPYNPTANAPYRGAPYFLQDASYYHGKLYLYFGITPALVLFWPWAVLTGHYLPHKYAVAIFCSAGFLVAALLFRAFWRRYFPEIGTAIATACVLALGLAAGTPLMLMRPGICEVPVGCAYLFTMLALAGVWGALHRPQAAVRWLAAGSLAYGLALGSRPSDLFGAALLLVPVWLAYRETRRWSWPLLAAAILPLTFCGLGLLLYNDLRFTGPADFGHDYQLSDIGQAPGFNLSYVGYNLRFYFLAPTFWSRFFPFAQGIRIPTLPSGYYPPESVFGILPNVPLVVLALAAPLSLCGRSGADRLRLQGFLGAAALLFFLILAPLLGYFAACGRYEVEFLPALLFLAAVGIFALERRWGDRQNERQTGRTERLAGRTAWVALLVFSIGFNLLVSCGRYAAQRYSEGVLLAQSGRRPEAAAKLELALAVNPGFAQAHLALGNLWSELGRNAEALAQYREAVDVQPNSALAHYILANALDGAHLPTEAVAQYRASLQLDPDEPLTHNNLGIALDGLRRFSEAAVEFEAALRLQPNLVEGHANLGNTYFLMGRLPDAIAQYEAALQLAPDDAGLRASLARAQQAFSNSR
jgi:tetratricopeptide (TPR) repeat protein